MKTIEDYIVRQLEEKDRKIEELQQIIDKNRNEIYSLNEVLCQNQRVFASIFSNIGFDSKGNIILDKTIYKGEIAYDKAKETAHFSISES